MDHVRVEQQGRNSAEWGCEGWRVTAGKEKGQVGRQISNHGNIGALCPDHIGFVVFSNNLGFFCNELWFPLRLVYSSSWGQVIARLAERQELKGYQKKWKVLCPLAFSWGPGAGREQAGGNEMSLAASVPRVTQQLLSAVSLHL